MRIVVLSTRTMGEKLVERLVERGEEVVAVGNASVPAGVTDRMELVARKYGIPFLRVKKASSPEFFAEYSQYRPDINVMGGLRAFLPETVLNYPKLGTLAWHPSLLPKYAGANSLCWPIIFGEKKSANTVYWADKGIDSGPICLQKEVEISPDDTFGSLYNDKIVPGAVETFVEALELIKKGSAPRVPQDLTQYTYFSFITEKDAIINWVQPGRRVYDLIRGTNPTPGATTNFGELPFKVLDAELQPGIDSAALALVMTGSLKAGAVIDVTAKGIRVAIPDGAILIKTVRFEGTKMAAADFAKQVGLEAGSKLGNR